MDALFIEPSSLPGGRAWASACSAIVREHNLAVSNGAIHTELPYAYEALGCTTSPFSGFFQVLLLLCVYGGILYQASELIAAGSELLLLVPSLRHIVGSVVLPILGAVPDGAIVLFSALGPNAQEELSVGVGALAGSTCMLLTVPWFLSIVAGRVNIRRDGVLTYHHRPNKLTPPNNFDLDNTGVQPMPMVQISGRTMMLTSLSYFVIQGAAIVSGTFFKATQTEETIQAAAKLEHWPAVFCLVVSMAFFIWYLYDQMTSTGETEKEYFETYVDEVRQKNIRSGMVSLTAAFQEIWDAAGEMSITDVDESTGLIIEEHKRERLAKVLKVFFLGYDHDHNKRVDKLELASLMRDLGEVVSADELTEMFEYVDYNKDGFIELPEFVAYMPRFIIRRSQMRSDFEVVTNGEAPVEAENGVDEEDTEEEEEEEVPEDLRSKDPATQIRNVMKRSFMMMAVGTALVLIFSDPMVSVLSDVGARIGVPAFYISFILAPLASNASELLAAFSYAKKKTRKTITISFSTLLGAAIMNNTFVLAIFMVLLTVKGLAWTFTAETISILVVEFAMGWMSQKRVMTLRDGFYTISLYPLALFIVAFLENVVGLD